MSNEKINLTELSKKLTETMLALKESPFSKELEASFNNLANSEFLKNAQEFSANLNEKLQKWNSELSPEQKENILKVIEMSKPRDHQ